MAAISLPTTSSCDGSRGGTCAPATDLRAREASCAGRCGADAEHRRRSRRTDRETVVQHERHALIRGEPLEHHHRGEPGVLVGDHRGQRIRPTRWRHDRLWQPLADVRLAPVRRGPQPIQADAAHHGRQPRPEIDDAVRPAPSASQRSQASWTASSASANVPVSRYATGEQMRTQPIELVDASAHLRKRSPNRGHVPPSTASRRIRLCWWVNRSRSP